jgi:hypothetical protein
VLTIGEAKGRFLSNWHGEEAKALDDPKTANAMLLNPGRLKRALDLCDGERCRACGTNVLGTGERN